MRRSNLVPAALAALLAAGCGAPGPAPAAAPPPTTTPPPAAADTATLRTGRARYSEHDVVDLTLRVGAERGVRVDLCRLSLERREGGAWRPAAPLAAETCAHSAPSLLPPGREVTVWRRIPAAYPLGEYRFTAAAEGRAPLATPPFAIVRHPHLVGLALRVRADRTVARPGDTIRLAAVVHNVGGGVLKVSSACGPALDVAIHTPAGDSLSALDERVDGVSMFTCEGRPENDLAPGDSLVQPLWWRAPRARGQYRMVAHARRERGVRPRSEPLLVTVR